MEMSPLESFAPVVDVVAAVVVTVVGSSMAPAFALS